MAALWAAAITAVGSVAASAASTPPAFGGSMQANPIGMFDNSGWTVATGSARASASRTETSGAELSDVQRMVPWLVVGIIGIVVAKAWRHRKS